MKRPAFLRSALALLLCLSMVLSFVPMQAAAAIAEPTAAYDCAQNGHDYKAGTFRATCEQHPRTHYSCSYCGDSYDVYAEELYSDWQETKPEVDESLIQTKTQYRTSQYETVTSYNSALDGYDKIGSQWSKIDTRSVIYVASWPAGFSTSNSLYNQYNKAAMKATASESDTRRTVIDSDEIVGYLYYHWCYEGYPYTVDTQSGNYNRFHAYYSTKSPSEANNYDLGDNSFRFDDSTACSDSKWYFYVPVYEQTYTNYRLEYIFGTWGNYSAWSDTKVEASENLKVATRTVYRYVNAPLADHNYNVITNDPSCTEGGQAVYTCTVCGHSYTQDLYATGHSFDGGECTICGAAEPDYYLFGWINGVDYGCNDDYENMGIYKFEEGKLTVTFEQDSYIGIKAEGNAAWYMTELYTSDDTGVFKNTSTGASEKMFVPGGVEITLVLADGEGDTLVLTRIGGGCTHNYDKTVVTEPTCTEGGLAVYTCSKCSETYTEELAAKGHDYRRGTCKGCGAVDEEYVTPNYYLVGYINGVDYGSQDDFENRGEFRFEGGKLVINCTQDSYVFVKTEGNTAWYMTSAYCTEASATLYDTRDGAMEKMFIPAYMEVTFTLEETENNTLLLSYEAVPCKHIYEESVLVAPGCAEDGIMLRTCRVCAATAEKPIPTTGHDYAAAVTEPGCITAGYTTYTCKLCGDQYLGEEVDAKGHDYESQVAQEPGCFTDGVMNYICKACGHTYSGTIASTGHNYVAVVTKPGCETVGYTTYTCNRCGDNYTADKVPAAGHSYQGVTTLAPTCVTDGLMTYTCAECGDAYLRTMEAMGHNYISELTKPTCTTAGYTTHGCTVCGYSYDDTKVAATGHKFVGGKCANCGELDGVGYYLFGFINGANYACEDDWQNLGQYGFVGGKLVVTFETDSYIGIKRENNADWYMTAAYTEETSVTFKHTSTGAKEKMFVPGGVELTMTLVVNKDNTLTLSYTLGEAAVCDHSYYFVMTTAPTCETAGVKTYTCNKCGYAYTEAMDPFNHSYKTVTVKPTCTATGTVTCTCLICGDSYLDRILAATGHTMQSVITTKPTCETAGITTHSCKDCDYTYATKVEATGHNYTSVVINPTCTEDGYTLHTCVCGDSYKNTEVPAIGHNYTALITKESTCAAAGVMSYTCENCNHSYTEDIPALAHDFVEGFCSVCGKSEICQHVWEDGVCLECGIVCEHEYVYGICSQCSEVDPFYVPSYYLVGYINGADYGCNADYENMGIYEFQDDKLVVTFEQDSYVFLKTAGNAGWYMTKEYVNADTATFYNTTTGSSEKMFVPGGVELVFSLTVKNDDTLILTYKPLVCEHNFEITGATSATCTQDGSITYTCFSCGDSYTEAVPATGHSYVGSSCELCGEANPDYVPDYYLIGYINGANYGCEEDHANMGSYKFVDGKLTATFDQDSYVFLKSEGNAAWYMTQSYSTETSAVFHNTGTGAAEKLFVPGNVEITFTLTVNGDDTLTLSYEIMTKPVINPTLTLKAPTLEFKDMITVNAMFTAENLDDVVEMGMITYTEKVDQWSVETAKHVIPGTTYDASTGRYIATSQGIHAKYLGDAVYLACYAKLTDGSYVYTKLASYSPVQYATSKLKGNDTALKQLVVAMLNYGAAAQTHFNHNVENLANATLTAEQIALPEAYRADMVSTVASPSANKQGEFYNNKGFSKRYPSISFEGAFCINYFFTPAYAPVGEITLYYWNAADYAAATILTTANASGSIVMEKQSNGEYRGDITGIAAKALGEGVYVAGVYTDGTDTWTSGVLGYSIGAYCSSQATKGGTIADLAMATAVYGYQAKAYFG